LLQPCWKASMSLYDNVYIFQFIFACKLDRAKYWRVDCVAHPGKLQSNATTHHYWLYSG
jgi:hypothetical protein